MWPKNATVYGINPKFKFAAEALVPFVPLEDGEGTESKGWAPVFDGALHFASGPQILLNFKQQKKSVPAAVIKEHMEERIRGIALVQGFPPGKLAKKELKERIIDELTPRAFATSRTTQVWLDCHNHRLIIDSSSDSVCDEVVSQLIRAFDTLGVQDVNWPRAAVITNWLVEEPEGYTTDDRVTLQYPGETGKLVKYSSTNLVDDDVQAHVQKGGASVESIAMTFKDRISFVMTQNMRLQGIKPLEILADQKFPKEDRFASEFALMTLEMALLLNDLGSQV